MSILLEALRKSEKSQHQPEAPSIHSNDQSDTVSESLQTGPLALLLVVALFASGWFVWRQYQLPEGIYLPPVTLSADQINAQTTPLEAIDRTTDGATDVASEAQPSSSVTDNNSKPPRTPVETFNPPPESKPQNTAKSPADSNRPDAGAKTGPGQSGSEKETIKKSGDRQQEKYQPQRPAPISYWELPDAVRADVPEIKFSVLVYAADPADRFVLINGQRLGEGDSAQPGLVVEEIRLDGVVFSYRLYQFLIEK